MFPLYDDNPTVTKPVVVYWLLGINIAIFLFEISLSNSLEINGRIPIVQQFFRTWAVVPAELFKSPNQEFLTLLSYQFLHASSTHVLGNMWFLWIFGNNIEETLGKGRFLLFYIACGIFAAILQCLFSLNSTIPLVGASGSISGIMGAYIVKYPRTRILTFIPPFFIIWLPAAILLGFWILGQTIFAFTQMGTGVAFIAHVAGFGCGVILFRSFTDF